MYRRTPEELTVDALFGIRMKLDTLWERADKTGLSTAQVRASQFGSAGTTFGTLIAEFSQKLSHLTEEAIHLKEEAMEE